MGGAFWNDENIPIFDPMTASLLAGVGPDLSPLENTDTGAVLHNTGLLQVLDDETGEYTGKNFGLLRATAMAYVQQQSLARDEEDGTIYINGPFLDAYNEIMQPSNDSMFSHLSLMRYRDPTKEPFINTSRGETMFQLLGTEDRLSLSNLIAVLNDNETVYGQSMAWETFFTDEGGLSKYNALLQSIYSDLATQAFAGFDSITSVSAPDAPTAPADIDAVTGSAALSGSASAGTLTTPDAPSPGAPATPPLINYGDPEVDGSPEGEDATGYQPVDYLPNTNLSDVAVSATLITDDDLDITDPSPITDYGLWSSINTLFTALSAITVDAASVAEGDITALLLSDIDYTPYVSTPASLGLPDPLPTISSVDDKIDDAVSSFGALMDLRYAEEESRIEASLSAGRAIMSTAYDNAKAILAGFKAAQIQEHDKALRVEAARLEQQRAIAEAQLHLDYHRIKASLIAQLDELVVRDTQFITELNSRYELANTENKMRRLLANADMSEKSILTEGELQTRGYESQGDLYLKAYVQDLNATLQSSIESVRNLLQARIASAENNTRAAIATAENYARVAMATVENLLRASIATAENLTRASITDAELANQRAISGAENLTRASITAGELSVRASISGAENLTRASIEHSRNILQAAITTAENITRVSLANADAETRTNLANSEISLRAAIATAENKMRVLELNSRYDLATLENDMRVLILNSELERANIENVFRANLAENERVLGELKMRSELAQTLYTFTLGWMNAKTSNASALANIITTGMQLHFQQTVAKRQFDMEAERLKWDIVAQRSGLIASTTELKWKSMIQNIMTIKEATSAIGMAPTGTESHPSTFTKANNVASSVLSLFSAGVNIASLF